MGLLLQDYGNDSLCSKKHVIVPKNGQAFTTGIYGIITSMRMLSYGLKLLNTPVPLLKCTKPMMIHAM